MNTEEKEFLLVTVIEDPHNGKTHFELEESEELDVGQIEDLSDKEIIDLGLKINKSPVFLHWTDMIRNVSESKTKKFNSLEELKEFISDKRVYCRWIKRHTTKLNCVMSFHEMPDGFDEKMNDLMSQLSLSIFNLMKVVNPEAHRRGEWGQLTVDVYNLIKEYTLSVK
jgi:hypothetical protein